MIQMKCIKLIELTHPSSDGTLYAKTTLGRVYTWEKDPGEYGEDIDGAGGIIDDVGDVHYMPSPLDERDPDDGWSTSDYFEIIQETK